MATNNLDDLAAVIKRERDPLLLRWRHQVRELPSARNLDVPTLNDHMPGLLDELCAALQSHSTQSISEALEDGSPTAHGLQRVKDEFDIEEVVAEYNILRGCIHDLAADNDLTLQGTPFHIINRVLDHAIGLALQTYATQRALDVQRRRDEYLAFVAHDLRTPLNAIALAGRVLEMTVPGRDTNAAIVQMFKTLRRNVQHLEGLIDKVLKESTNLEVEIGIKLERREFDLWPLVEALIHDLQAVAGTSSTRLLNQVPDDLVVYADAGLLRRVLQNLIANAIKFTPRGEVVITAKNLAAGGGIECRVSDNGEGIPAKFLDKVFDKGETSQGREGGMGLGLAIVKTFIEVHDGEVSVESREGAGTTFRFSLPAKVNSRPLTNH